MPLLPMVTAQSARRARRILNIYIITYPIGEYTMPLTTAAPTDRVE